MITQCFSCRGHLPLINCYISFLLLLSTIPIISFYSTVDAVEVGAAGSSSKSSFSATVVIDAYPNNATVEQGATLILVCRVVGVPSITVLSYQWTCPGGYCDAGEVDLEWAARIQQGNLLVVNVRRQNVDNGTYTCTVKSNSQQVGVAMYTLSVASEFFI